MAGKEWKGDFDPLADPVEKQHLLSVLNSFRSYRRLAHFNGTHIRRQAFYSLPNSHWTLLSQPPFSLLSTFNKLDDLIDANAELSEAIFCTGFKAFLAPSINSEWVASIVPQEHAHDEFKVYSTVMDHLGANTSHTDMDKARSCVNQFYREWSAEGAVERAKCFDPVVAALRNEFARRLENETATNELDLSVLVPGAGLGRLVFDICRAGFTVQGNEISYHELMASSFVLNHTQRARQFAIAPFALNGSNHLCRDDQFQTFHVPDVLPAAALIKQRGSSSTPAHDRMSMSTGDFCVLYNQTEYKDAFDVVATVFFVDTAPNIIRYVEAVRNCLRKDGIWINLGPLLWHHASLREGDEHKHGRPDGEKSAGKAAFKTDAGIGDPGSVELTDDEVVALVRHMGFSIESYQVRFCETGYISNLKSMLQSTYRPSMWIARKA